MERSDIANAIRRCKGGELCRDTGCPYAIGSDDDVWWSGECIGKLYDDILTIMTPVDVEIDGGNSIYFELCSECRTIVGSSKDKFCRQCGRPLNWDTVRLQK